jgi:hypothetical protein
MSTRNEHLRLLNQGQFPVPADVPGLTADERLLLGRYGFWLQALVGGRLSPITPEQERFVAVAWGLAVPVSQYERAWVKLRPPPVPRPVPPRETSKQPAAPLSRSTTKPISPAPSSSASVISTRSAPPKMALPPEPVSFQPTAGTPSDRKCSLCSNWIPAARLEVVPDTRLCVPCQEEWERRGGGELPAVADLGEVWFSRSECWRSKLGRGRDR